MRSLEKQEENQVYVKTEKVIENVGAGITCATSAALSTGAAV